MLLKGIILHLHHNALENSWLYFCITWCIFLITFPSQILSEIFNVFCETSSKNKVYFGLNKVLLFVNVWLGYINIEATKRSL